MKYNFILISFFSLFLLLFCQDKNPLEPQNATIKINGIGANTGSHTQQSSVELNGSFGDAKRIICEGGAERVVINQSGYFRITVPLKLNQLNILLVYGEINTNQYTDTTIVEITHDNIPPQVIDYSGLQTSAHVLDSISITFNEPVFISEIYKDYGSWQVDLKDKAVTEGNSIKFISSSSFLYDYIFSYKVRDRAGNGEEGIQIIPFYDKKFELSGTIMDFETDSECNILYVATENPNQLTQINLIDNSIIKQTGLSARPTKIAYNHYNELLYITSLYDSKVLVVNSKTGTEFKTLQLAVSEGSHSQHDNNHPYSIAFASNGIGLVSSVPIGISWSYTFHIINSTENDSIIIHPDFYNESSYDGGIISSSSNGEYLIIGGQGFKTFDPETFKIHDIIFDSNVSGRRGVAINKKNDKIAGTNISNTFMANINGSVIGTLNRWSSPSAIMEFNYNQSHRNFVYHISYLNKDINLYDMDNEIELFRYNIRFPQVMRSLVNGKYLVFGTGNLLFLLSDETLNKHTEIIF